MKLGNEPYVDMHVDDINKEVSGIACGESTDGQIVLFQLNKGGIPWAVKIGLDEAISLGHMLIEQANKIKSEVS